MVAVTRFWPWEGWLLPGAANSLQFRVPVEPILSVTAAIGWLGMLDWRRRCCAGGQVREKTTADDSGSEKARAG